MWMMRAKSGRRRELGKPLAYAMPETLMERLEAREMLYLGPGIANPPPISSLESSGDTVMRIITGLGAIDIELFDTVAPNTVNNFRSYVNSGKIDESFFTNLDGNTLRAGGYKFADGTGLSTVATVAPVANEFSRSNLAQTIAMWKPDGQPNGATTQFFFNLTDNPTLNSTNGGYTVFGKVVQGWSVVQSIAALSHVDLHSQFGTAAGTFGAVPVMASYNPLVGPTEATLVKIIDIEAMKPVANGRFYENQYIFADGSRDASSIESIDLTNMTGQGPNVVGPSLYNAYQVIVHYDTGDRDSVILTGALLPEQRISLKVNDLNAPNYNLVRMNSHYSIEVRSGRAMGVAFNHREQGAQVGEELPMVPQFSAGAFHTWNFAAATKGPTQQNTVAWQSITDQITTVNVGLYPDTGAPRTFSFQLKPFRRGSVSIQDLGNVIPDGNFSIQVSANQPIVAVLTSYTLNGAALDDGSATQGGLNAGGTVGYLAAAQIPTSGSSFVDLFYTAGAQPLIIIDLTFILSNGTQLPASPVTLTSSIRRARVDLSTANGSLPTNTFFSIRYAVRNNAANVTANYTAKVAGDTMQTIFQTAATSTVVLADGYTDPTIVGSGEQETISVFNPYINVPAANSFFFQLLFHFSDGTIFYGPLTGVGSWHRVDTRIQDVIEPTTNRHLIDVINSNAAYRFYSVEVISAQLTLPIPSGGVVAQITRLQNTWGQSVTSTAGLDARAPVTFLSNASEYGTPS